MPNETRKLEPLDIQAPPPLDPAAMATVFDALGAEIITINAANGWNVTIPADWDESGPYKIPAILALIHSEATEALEAFRKGDIANFTEELADVLIRVFDCAHGLGLDLAGATLAKLDKNRARGYRHGGKRV